MNRLVTAQPDLQGQLGPRDIPYCHRCGRQVEFRDQKIAGYTRNGAPVIELRYDCPARPRWHEIRQWLFPVIGHARLRFHTGFGWDTWNDA